MPWLYDFLPSLSPSTSLLKSPGLHFTRTEQRSLFAHLPSLSIVSSITLAYFRWSLSFYFWVMSFSIHHSGSATFSQVTGFPAFEGRVIFHWWYLSLLCPGTSGLVPHLGWCQHAPGNLREPMSLWNHCSIPRSRITGTYGGSIFNF